MTPFNPEIVARAQTQRQTWLPGSLTYLVFSLGFSLRDRANFMSVA